MRLIRFARDLQDLRGTYRALATEAARADDEASYRLTVTARGFARRSRKVVDDKLSFSATLMRAGEVHAANRLLDEVQTEVRTEEAALIEQVNEAKVAQAARKEKMTRLRMVRMVAVAIMGSMLMGISAVGMAAVSYLDAREADAARAQQSQLKIITVEHKHEAHKLARRFAGRKDKRVADILMKLSLADLQALKELTAKGVDAFELERFLVAVLPSHKLAQELTKTIVGAAGAKPLAAASPVVAKTVTEGASLLAKAKKKARSTTTKSSSGSSGSGSSGGSSGDDTRSQEKKTTEEEEPSSPLPKDGPLGGGESSSDSDKDDEQGLLD